MRHPLCAPNTVNYCDNGGPVDLFPKTRLHSAFLTARQQIGDSVTLWGDILYSDRKDKVQAAIPPQTVVLTAANTPSSARHPGRAPFSRRSSTAPDNIVGSDHFDQTYRVKTGNSSAGADVKLGDFNLSAYGT